MARRSIPRLFLALLRKAGAESTHRCPPRGAPRPFRLSDRRERMLASGLGTDLACTRYRSA
jgi:hypothetical protein